MISKVYNFLDKSEIDEVNVPKEISDLKVRQDLIKLVVDWQLAKRRKGCHKVKNISEVSGTGKKPHPQKKTGRARQGSLRSTHMRGGGNVHGPVVRSHAFKLNKKIRTLGLLHVISDKFQNKKLWIVNDIKFDQVSTSLVKKKLKDFDAGSFFIVDDELNKNLFLSVRNLHTVKVVPFIGMNVYDILSYENLLLPLSVFKKLENRL